jgi:transposase-like protein
MSANLFERVNEKIKRLTHMAGTFPNPPAIERQVGVVLLEKGDHW